MTTGTSPWNGSAAATIDVDNTKVALLSGATFTGNVIGTNVTLSGTLSAATKSFLIKHPTKSEGLLRYGSLEGPENGVYVRGRSTSDTIELPDYWTELVDENTITVSLTPIGKKARLFVKSVENNTVFVGGTFRVEYSYIIFAERKDVPKLIVEE
jgi:hypothetical protein